MNWSAWSQSLEVVFTIFIVSFFARTVQLWNRISTDWLSNKNWSLNRFRCRITYLKPWFYKTRFSKLNDNKTFVIEIIHLNNWLEENLKRLCEEFYAERGVFDKASITNDYIAAGGQEAFNHLSSILYAGILCILMYHCI